MRKAIFKNFVSCSFAVFFSGLCLLGTPVLARDVTGTGLESELALERAFEHSRTRVRSEGQAPAAYEIFVSPKGDDAWSGQHAAIDGNDGPVRNLTVAQRKARELSRAVAAGEKPARPVHVVLLPGVFRLSQTLVFDERDSGRPGQPVVYRADQPGTAIVSGGIDLPWLQSSGNMATFRVPPTANVDWRGAPQLFVNGRRAILARMPHAGKYWFVQPPDPTRPDLLQLDPEATQWLSSLNPQDRARMVLNLYQAWTTSRHHVVDGPLSSALAIEPKPHWPYLNFGRSQRFFVENVSAALDSPGEWFGADDKVSYFTRPAETGRPLVATLPVLPKLVAIGSASADGMPVHDLEFRDLDFQHAVYITPPTGFIDNQAASGVGAAIEVDGARRIVFDHCSIRHVGAHGIWLRSDVHESTLSGNLFADLGAGAIRVGVNTPPAKTELASSHNNITSNLIADTGAVLPGGVGIWLGMTWDNQVTHNLVADTTYTGISVGWKWGFGSPGSGRNLIAKNLLVNIGQGELADLGGIYTLGESPGTVIEGNVVREVRSYPEYGPGGGRGAAGIYQDEGTSDTLVERNIVVGSDSAGYQLHFGRNNTLRQNLFAYGDEAELRIYKVKADDVSVIATGNLFVTQSKQPFLALASEPNIRFKDDVVSAPSPAATDAVSRCGGGCRVTQIALTLGPNPKDIQLSGLSQDAGRVWRDVLSAAGPDLPELATATPVLTSGAITSAAIAATLPVHIKIAEAPIGSQPAGLNYRPLSDFSAIRIEERGERGSVTRCLSFNDSSSFKNRFEPFAFAELGQTRGRWTAHFRLWVDGRSEFVHEWRDGGSPAKAGPSLTIAKDQVLVNGKVVAVVQPNTWNEFAVTSTIGAHPGSWTLEITDAAGHVRRVSGLPPRNADWSELRWVGFISNAVDATRSCVASVDITPVSP